MYVARIVGTVVCTKKAEKLTGLKVQIVQPLNMVTLRGEGNPAVAVDAVGAGVNEVVLVVTGSSARQTTITEGMPVDATITAIVDSMEIDGRKTFDNSRKEEN